MSKSKKRHNNSAAVRARARDSALADKQVRDRARMDPVARSLLLVDLVFLAAGQMLYTHGMLPDWASGVVNILGIIMLVVGPPVRRQEARGQAAPQIIAPEKAGKISGKWV